MYYNVKSSTKQTKNELCFFFVSGNESAHGIYMKRKKNKYKYNRPKRWEIIAKCSQSQNKQCDNKMRTTRETQYVWEQLVCWFTESRANAAANWIGENRPKIVVCVVCRQRIHAHTNHNSKLMDGAARVFFWKSNIYIFLSTPRCRKYFCSTKD